jgi:hypothetical protein
VLAYLEGLGRDIPGDPLDPIRRKRFEEINLGK